MLREHTLALRKAKLGPDHPDTLSSMHSLANSYDALGRPAEALMLREHTLALRKAKLGPDHPDTLSSMHSLANSYTALGRQAEALQLREHTLALRKAMLGPDHPDTLSSMPGLADSSMNVQIDRNTGTAHWRSAIPNPDGLFLPGMSARVRLSASAPYKALLVAEQAVQVDGEAKFVWVVTGGNHVEKRRVNVGSFQDGLFSVKEGLKADDRVVLEWIRFHEGEKFELEEVPMPGDAPAGRNPH
jgi:hypothetical protein